MNVKNLFGVIGLVALTAEVFSIPATAAPDNGWTMAGETNQGVWSIQNGSFYVSKNGAGEPIAVVTGRLYDKQTTGVMLYKWYVTVSACKAHMGKVTTTDLDGQFLFDNDYVQGAGSVASSIGDDICQLYAAEMAQIKAKSI
jgi:hypothetical protein